jgi:hypothetical protein
MIMDHMHGFNEMHVLIFVNFFILFFGAGGGTIIRFYEELDFDEIRSRP